VINTDGGPMSVWVAGAPFRLVAVDGTDVRGPTEVRGSRAGHGGGRADLELTMPDGGEPVRVQLAGRTGVLAAQGLVAHLAYQGVSTPFSIGGAPGNHPE
jgi:hypothetical protein